MNNSQVLLLILLAIVAKSFTQVPTQAFGGLRVRRQVYGALVDIDPSVYGEEVDSVKEKRKSIDSEAAQLMIIAPEYIRPRRSYHVLVSLANSSAPAEVDIDLIPSRRWNCSHAATKSVLAKSGEAQLADFSIGDWPAAEYSLRVNAQAVDGSWNYTAEKKLACRARTFSCIMQIDKAVYRPGQQVQLRVLFLSPTNRPVEFKNEINVAILGPRRNVLKQLQSLSSQRGSLSLDMPLPENLERGMHFVRVEAEGLRYEKQFTVAESEGEIYLTMQLPSYLTYNDTDIVATVKASYLDGKPVQGHVTLTAQTFYFYVQFTQFWFDESNDWRVTHHRLRLNSDGIADFFLKLAKDKKVDTREGKVIEFIAVVEDDLTGQKYNQTRTLTMHRNNIKIENLGMVPQLEPIESAHLRYRVVYQDGMPVEDDGPEVELDYTIETLIGAELDSTFKSRPRGGLIEHELKIVPRISMFYSVLAKYRNQTFDSIFMNLDPRRDIRINLPQFSILNKYEAKNWLLNDSISINDKLKVEVSIDWLMHVQQVTCYGLSRGDIVWAQSRRVMGETRFDFDIELDERMAPKMRIVCFGTQDESKSLVADAIEVPVSGPMTRRIEVLPDHDEAEPGQKIGVSVTANPNSLVGLLKFDQSAFLQQSENDLNPFCRGSQPKIVYDYLGGVVLANSIIVWLCDREFKTFQVPFFPETRHWQYGIADSRGQIKFNISIHDTVGSWQLSAFSLSKSHGLALTGNLMPDRVVKQFFISFNLPHSIILGKTISIKAILHNYSKKPIKARLTLDNQRDELEFVEAANTIRDEIGSPNTRESRLVNVPAGGSAPISFLVKPIKLGLIEVRAVAHAGTIGDGVVKRMLVKPPGQEQHMNKTYLYGWAESQSGWSHNVSIEVPSDAVEGSRKVFVSVSGAFSGTERGLSSLENLLQRPKGDSEVNLAQSVAVRNYFRATRRFHPTLVQKAEEYSDEGYGYQIGYENFDDLSAFGESDKVGSVWLTVHALKTLQRARVYTHHLMDGPDSSVSIRVASFIGRHVRPDGSIKEVGMLHNISLASSSLPGDAESVYLTAYSLIALLQVPLSPTGHPDSNKTQIERVIRRGLNYLESQLDRNSSDSSLSSALTTRELAMIAYTMSLAGSERQIAAERAYKMLWDRANQLNDHTWLSDSKANDTNDKKEASTDWSGTGQRTKFESMDKANQKALVFDRSASDVEVSSWALLVATERRDIKRSLPIALWLTSQQRSDGGFGSSQDTIVAIEALTIFAEARPPISIDVEFHYPKSASTTSGNGSLPTGRTNLDRVHISESDTSIQLTRLPDNITWVQIEASGTGSAVVQVSWQYNLLA